MTVHSNFSQLVVFLCETLPKRKTSRHRSLFGNFGRRQILIILKYHEISGESWSGGRKFISGTLPSMNLRLCFHFVPTIAAGTFKPAQKKASTIDVTFLAMSYMIKGFQLNPQLFKARSFHFTCKICQAAGGLQQAWSFQHSLTPAHPLPHGH